jgi:plasmid stabilization system protein ParE
MLAVAVTPRTAAQIEAAARWWVKNRPAAPDALRLDFQEAKELLSRQPGIGAKSRSHRYPGLRRIYLSRIRYHVYYEERPGTIVILAFWHSSRGTGPGL